MAFPQVRLVSGDYFPADFEFQELPKAASEEVFEDPDRISGIEHGSLFLDLGCKKYARRVYSIENSGSLSIEVATVADAPAAYSLLTLLGDSAVHQGPPGDDFISNADTLLFAQGKEWVRIKGKSVSKNLIERIGGSVSNRIGKAEREVPPLIAHLPSPGYDPSSLLYFSSLKPYETYFGARAREYLKFNSDAEIAEARYTLGNQTGDLFLLSFPTPQVAEEYYERLPGMNPVRERANTLYAKKAGPLVALLEGAFDPRTAERILGPLKFEYSIRWIYDKNNENRIAWGIPTPILGTVVKSLFFVALLCLVSIAAGAGFAFFRFALREHGSGGAADRSEQTDIIRLRLK